MDAPTNRLPISSEDLDRLADGSLPDADRRALLARLDGEPDAWRRCALAFLEAQAWREAFGTMTAGPARVSPMPGDRSPLSARLRVLPIALAAGLIGAAFLLGRLTVEPGHVGIEGPALGPRVAHRDVSPGPIPDDSDDFVAAPHDLGSWADGIQAVGYLSLPTALDPESPVVELPVLAGPGLDDRWLRDQPSFVPEEVRRGWEQLGYAVESQRRLVSVQLDEDGRYLTIPVDEVMLRADDRRTY